MSSALNSAAMNILNPNPYTSNLNPSSTSSSQHSNLSSGYPYHSHSSNSSNNNNNNSNNNRQSNFNNRGESEGQQNSEDSGGILIGGGQRDHRFSGNTQKIVVGKNVIQVSKFGSSSLNKKEAKCGCQNSVKHAHGQCPSAVLKQIQPENLYVKRMEDDEKLRKYMSKLTLAQRMGLVQAPPKPLNSEDWSKIEEQSQKRNDSDGCCAICLEDFKDQEQIILSCSHTFHKGCLSSFEKHNQVKTCPICRRKNYEKKGYNEGAKIYLNRCATHIQKIWKGGVVRLQFYLRLLEEKYQAENIRFRRRILGYQLMTITSKMSKDIEKNVKKSQLAAQNLEQKFQKKQDQIYNNIQKLKDLKVKNQNEANNFLIYQRNVPSEFLQRDQQEQKELLMIKKSENKKKISNDDWCQIKNIALERCEKDKEDCSICYHSLLDNQQKALYILSCTHIFHANCINAFQRYNLNQTNSCPICRSHYEKLNFMQTSQ